ncbi:hypothetical protein AAEP93_001851 [Penicillium crustosum]
MLPYEALYSRKPDLSNLRALGCQCWFLILKEKRPIKLDLYIEEARLIAYDEGDNYVLYNIRTKKIERSRNVIFNENPLPVTLLDPEYDLNFDSVDEQPASQSPERHVPIDFLYDEDDCREIRQYLDNLYNARSDSRSPPPPSVEDDIDDIVLAPANPLLDPSNPLILEYRVPEIDRVPEIESVSLPMIDVPLPDPDTFDLPGDDNKMAGSLGRFTEVQREDDSPHFDVGGAGALVEPQPASR